MNFKQQINYRVILIFNFHWKCRGVLFTEKKEENSSNKRNKDFKSFFKSNFTEYSHIVKNLNCTNRKQGMIV